MVEGQFAVAIVGFGGMGNWHSDTISSIDNIFVKGVYDIDEKRARYAESKGLIAYNSLEEVLSDKDIDIVTIATPNNCHKEIAIKAMRAGKNVVCEKPVALNSNELSEMIAVSEESKVLFEVHQNRRWDSDFLTIKKIIDSGVLGNIFNIESRVHGSRGIPGDWRTKKEFGGGMVLDWGVHILDQMLLLFDEKVKKVYANLTYVTNTEVDDGFRVILTFESGITALLEVGTSNFTNLPRWYLNGINGTAVIEGFNNEGKIVSLSGYDEKEVTPVITAAGLTKTMAPRDENAIKESPLPWVESDIRDYYKNIMAAIKGEAELIVKPHEVMRVMKLMEAMLRSSELGCAVDFE